MQNIIIFTHHKTWFLQILFPIDIEYLQEVISNTT